MIGWLADYRRDDLASDLIAGIITATLLIPQAMAYSQLAGLPPQIGLYASMLPPVLYALFGSSRTLAVGPVAVSSLMLAAALGTLWPAGSADYVAGAFIVACLVGITLTLMGVARLGVLANFLSHPVLSGFTNAAALVIIVSQLKHLLGLAVPQGGVFETVGHLAAGLGGINEITAAIGAVAILLLVVVARRGRAWLGRAGVPDNVAGVAVRLAPLTLVALATLAVWLLNLGDAAGVSVVGAIPRGLPEISPPAFDMATWASLLAASVAIALVSFVESLSVAKVLAARRREKVDANRELIGLGVANLGASFTGASPVCGGFSRSVVNFEAGAKTQLAGVITALTIAVAAVLLTPLLFHLPVAALAAIVVVSVAGLFDVHTLRLCWRYNKADAIAFIGTFAVVLGVGMEAGIAVGVLVSLALFLWRTGQPHAAVVGRVGETEHFRNVLRHSVTTYPGILAIRVDESLYFANSLSLEELLLNAVAERPELEHLVLICNAVNYIDTSALETLENVVLELRNANVTVHLAEIKGPVFDRLERTELLDKLRPGRVFLSTHEAIEQLTGQAESV
jgi:SulP family sulfate permease